VSPAGGAEPASAGLETAALDVSAIEAQLAGILRDTVSPRITLLRLVLILRARLPQATACGLTLTPPGAAAPLTFGDEVPPCETDGARLAAPVQDAAGTYGEIAVQLPPSRAPREEVQRLLAWLGRAAAPVARIVLGLDVPHNPRP
jgi:hypothetical protein